MRSPIGVSVAGRARTHGHAALYGFRLDYQDAFQVEHRSGVALLPVLEPGLELLEPLDLELAEHSEARGLTFLRDVELDRHLRNRVYRAGHGLQTGKDRDPPVVLPFEKRHLERNAMFATNRFLIILALGVALVAAGCGSSNKKSSASSNTTTAGGAGAVALSADPNGA